MLEDNGTDVTEMFVTGAELAVERAVASGCVAAVLTDGSPSCGTTYVYDGGFTGGTIPGMGVTAQLLSDRGIAVFAESQIEEADRFFGPTRAGSRRPSRIGEGDEREVSVALVPVQAVAVDELVVDVETGVGGVGVGGPSAGLVDQRHRRDAASAAVLAAGRPAR